MTDKARPPSTGKALRAVLTGDREAIRRKVRAHQPSPEAKAFMEPKSTEAPRTESNEPVQQGRKPKARPGGR